MAMEKKSFPFEVKAVDDNTFEGYASIFGNTDSYGDVVEPGAFKKTIKENAKRIKVLWQHSPFHPIGKPEHMEEDSKGLYVKAKLSMTNFGKDAIILIKDGVINELSIGYNTIKEEWDKATNLRKLKELKLWEFSPVTFAANDLANITGAKNADLEQLLWSFNQELKAGKLLNSKSEALIKQAIDALNNLLKADDDDTEDDEEEKRKKEEQEVKDLLAFMKSLE